MKRVAIVGCGQIGHRRARALGDWRLVAVADTSRERAERLAAGFPGCQVAADWQRVVERPDVDAVVVAATNDVLAAVTRGAVEAGKHVLVEKPAARTARELEPVVAAARSAGVVVKVGFNHRFHPALARAKALVDEGRLDRVLFVRARYGHGGRPGYDREWRADPEIAGGGELLDQGIHLIDLARWFAGDFHDASGHAGTFFWSTPVEDNAFVLLRSDRGPVAWLHASWTEWKNLFSFEIVGRQGKLQIDGLGGSYGTERLTHYHMLPEMGPPETTIWEFPGEDGSWRAEWSHFAECISRGGRPSGDLEDALAALRLIGQIYGAEAEGAPPLRPLRGRGP